MTSIAPYGEQPGQDFNNIPDNLPLLTRVVKEEPLDDLPTLTEVVTETQPAADLKIVASDAITPPLCAFSDDEIQQLLLRLGTHLETAFATRLNLRLEQLQRQAIEQAINELKAELPELLRDALNAQPKL